MFGYDSTPSLSDRDHAAERDQDRDHPGEDRAVDEESAACVRSVMAARGGARGRLAADVAPAGCHGVAFAGCTGLARLHARDDHLVAGIESAGRRSSCRHRCRSVVDVLALDLAVVADHHHVTRPRASRCTACCGTRNTLCCSPRVALHGDDTCLAAGDAPGWGWRRAGRPRPSPGRPRCRRNPACRAGRTRCRRAGRPARSRHWRRPACRCRFAPAHLLPSAPRSW